MIKSHPLFAANQVLTHEHLNEIVTYLDREDRQSRTRLLGVGIICGLELRSDLLERVVVGKGCGLTTTGDLLELESDVTYTHRRAYDDPARYFTGSRQPEFPIWEVMETPQAPTPGVTTIASEPDFLRERVAVLFLEVLEKDLRSCVENDCNEKGRRRQLTPRVLLVAKKDADKLALPQDTTFTPPVAPATLRVPRPIFSDRVAPFGLLDYADVVSAFSSSVQEVEASLSSALEETISRLQPALGTALLSGTVANILKTQRESLKNGQGIQYIYDWVKDLTAAYQELAEVASRIGSRCCPDQELFPRHLLLGELEDNLATTYRPPRVPRPRSPYRHPFLPSPAVGSQTELRERAACLLQRLILQLEKFSWKSGTKIAITPDAGPLASLERRSLPHYYSLAGGAPSLVDHWSYSRTSHGWQSTLPSFWADESSELGKALDPLRYDHDGATFFRIEGHLEQRVETVLAFLEGRRRTYGLPFQVLAVAFDNTVAGKQTDQDCRSADLEAVYDELREEYRCALEREKQYFESLTPPPANSGRIKGRIEKAPDVPVLTDRLRVKVIDTGEIFTADEQGNFDLDLPEGSYVLQAFSGDYVGDRIFLDVDPNKETAQNLNIKKDVAQPTTRFTKPAFSATAGAGKRVKDYIQDYLGMPDPKEAPNRLELLDLVGTWSAAGKVDLIRQIGLPARIALLLGQALALLPGDLGDLSSSDMEALKRNLQDLKSTASSLETQLLDIKTALTSKQIQQLQHLQALQAFCHPQKLETLRASFTLRQDEQKRRLLFSEFLAEHPSLEHLGGVPRGGTFVVAYQEGLVKADFALPYRCGDPCGALLLRIPDSLPPPQDFQTTLSFASPTKTIIIPEVVTGNVVLKAILTDPGTLATLRVEDAAAGKIHIEGKVPLFSLREYSFEYLVQAKDSEKTALGKVFLALINDQPLPTPADMTIRTASATTPLTVKPPDALPASMQVINAVLSSSTLGVVSVEASGKEVRFQPQEGFTTAKRADITYTLRNIESQKTVPGKIIVLLEQTLPTIVLPAVTVTVNPLYLKSTLITLPLADKPNVIVESIEPLSPSVGTLALKSDRGPIYFTPARIYDRNRLPSLPELRTTSLRTEVVRTTIAIDTGGTTTPPIIERPGYEDTVTITYKVKDTVTGARGTGRIILKFTNISDFPTPQDPTE